MSSAPRAPGGFLCQHCHDEVLYVVLELPEGMKLESCLIAGGPTHGMSDLYVGQGACLITDVDHYFEVLAEVVLPDVVVLPALHVHAHHLALLLKTSLYKGPDIIASVNVILVDVAKQADRYHAALLAHGLHRHHICRPADQLDVNTAGHELVQSGD